MAFDQTQFEQFSQDPNQFGAYYGMDADQSAQRLQMLQDALAYAQAHPELENSQYILGELNNDITAQQSVGNYIGKSGEVESQSQKIKDIEAAYNTLMQSTTYQQFNKNAKALNDLGINVPTGTPPKLGTGQTMSDKTFLEQQLGWAKSKIPGMITSGYVDPLKGLQEGQNQAQSDLLNKFHVSRPDYTGAQKKLTDWFGTPGSGGQIDLATQQPIEDIYQTAYNLRNQVNQRAAQIGAGNSGFRKKAISNIGGQAIQQAAGVVGQAQNQAQSSIQDFEKNAQAQQRKAQDLENKVKAGTAGDLLTGANRDAVGSYNLNTQAQLDEQLAKDQERLYGQANNNDLASGIVGGFGNALGRFSGAFV